LNRHGYATRTLARYDRPQSPPEVKPLPSDPAPGYQPEEAPDLPPDFDQPDVSPEEMPVTE
jgi:hypothetical protein